MSTAPEPRLCYSYLRFSRAEQAKGDSTRRQEALRDAYIARHNLVLNDSRTILDPGCSAYYGRNSVEGNLAAFLSLVKQGLVPPGSVLLLESLDRFSRDQVIPARNALENLLLSGIDVHTLSPERILTRESLNDTFSLMMMIFEFSRSHEYSQQLSRRVGSAWSNKRRKAADTQAPLSKTTPAWLRVSVDGKYEIIPERAEVVELIFKLSVDGLGVNLIAKELNLRQIPTFNGKKEWQESYISKILGRENVIGHHHPTRIDPQTRKKIPTEKIENLFPAVISETLFAQGRLAFKNRKNNRGMVNYETGSHPFGGLLSTHSGGSIRIKYRAIGRKNPQMVPFLKDQETGTMYDLATFEFYMLGFLVQYEPAPTKKSGNAEINKLEEKIAKLDLRIETLKNQINQEEEAFQSFFDLLRKAEKDKAEVNKRLQERRVIEATEPITQVLKTVEGIFERLSPADGQEPIPLNRETNLQLRAVLRRMVTKIELTISTEQRLWKHKSLRATVHFRDGAVAEFLHRP